MFTRLTFATVFLAATAVAAQAQAPAAPEAAVRTDFVKNLTARGMQVARSTDFLA